jgi:hypothetical protein
LIRSGTGQEHLHIYCRNNQIFALNKDGTAHDKSHGVTIPNKVAKALKTIFPNFNIPDNNLIESAPRTVDLLFRIDEILSAGERGQGISRVQKILTEVIRQK